jgi:hypothetical protein
LESPLQIYELKARQDTTFVAAKGTIVHVPANAFDVAAGTAVTFRIRESVSTSDFLLDNLSTMSDENILFSGGMLYMDALVNGKPIGLKGELTVTMPTNERIPEMEYFTGSRDAHNKQVNWTTAATRGIRSLGFPRLQEPINDRYYFQNLLMRAKADSCGSPLLVAYEHPLPPRRIDPPVRYVEAPNFWERLRLAFGGKPKEQPKKEEVRYIARQPEIRYRLADSLSEHCKEIGNFALNTGLQGASWDQIHLQFRNDWYRKTQSKTYKELIRNLEFEIIAQQKIYEQKVIAFERAKVIRRKSLERAIENRVVSGKVSIEDMNAYVFQTNTLGFINCDAFYSVSPDRMVVMATDEVQTGDADVKLVFKKRKSILPCTVVNDKLVFRNIPKGEEAVIVAFKIENGKPYLAMQNVVTTSEVQNLVYKPTTIAALREKVKTLDGL